MRARSNPMFDKFHEECGVVAIYGHPGTAKLAYLGLMRLSTAGRRAAGICTTDGIPDSQPQSMGHVADIFTARCWRTLSGGLAIGHTRYSTAGDTCCSTRQPFSGGVQ